jgi:pyruvate ferredoxin oxidoreductase gamma subunit
MAAVVAIQTMTEVRWHGRGGQGAKTASELLAVAFLREGRFVQAFPEYGPERTGAPMLAYTRIAQRPIRRHCAITEPDIVIVLDAGLLREVPVTAGLRPDGRLLVSAEGDPGLGHQGPLLWLPADRLARETGTRFANVVMLGAFAGWLGAPTLADLGRALAEVMPGLGQAARHASLAAMAAGHAAGLRGMRDAD